MRILRERSPSEWSIVGRSVIGCTLGLIALVCLYYGIWIALQVMKANGMHIWLSPVAS